MIRQITIPPALLADVGLSSPSTLRDLGPIVLLAGANGSGKTRYLQVASTVINRAGEWFGDPKLEQHAALLAPRMADPDLNKNERKNIQRILDLREAYLGVFEDGPSGPGPLLGRRRAIQLTYSLQKEIADANRQSQEAIGEAVVRTADAGFANSYQNAHSYLTVVARRLFNAGHRDFPGRKDIQQQKADAEQFNAIVKALLGVEVGWAVAYSGLPVPLIMGRSFDSSELSSGQKILLAWAIILHRQREHLHNAVVIIDEPENHLHPDVCIRALDKLKNEVLGEQGQIWMGTHSIPLIAWAGFEAIHFVHDGKVEYAGNRVDEVVNGLAGGVEGRERLRTFLADAEDLALFKFAAECVTAPAVAHSKGHDPQETAFTKIVAGRAKAGRALRLLDFGAGHGRLAAALTGARRSAGDNLPTLHFLAFDQGKPCDDACRRHLATLATEPGVTTEYVEDLRSLSSDSQKVDGVVLCNVLHEIPVTRWLKLFEQVQKILVDDGCVILMEDQTPSVGELPSLDGFLILDLIETRRLFGDHSGVRAVAGSMETRWERRLTVIEIQRAALANANSGTIVRALADVQERAKNRITELRDKAAGETAFQRGRLHALYSMLWVNAQMAADAYGAGK